MSGVKIVDVAQKMDLRNLTPDIDLEDKVITVPDVNRPALQLTGYFDHFDSVRVQIIGYVEYTYLQTLTAERKKEIYREFFSYGVPCVIFTTEIFPDEEFLSQANETKTPVFATGKKTSPFQAQLIRWLNKKMAPCISIHGVLVDVYGVGVLIMGESGIGKSNCRFINNCISLACIAVYKTLNLSSFKKMFFNYFFYIVIGNTAVECTVRINDNNRAQCTKTETSGLYNLYFFFKTKSFDIFFKRLLNLYTS